MEDQGWLAWFSIRALQGKPVTIYGDGKQVRLIRACRALFFARVGLAKGDIAFGALRLLEAAMHSFYWTARVAALRIWRRIAPRRRGAAETWVIPGCDA